MALVKEQLAFQPGSRHSYSNDGFIVLGAVIERIAGRSYGEHVAEHIFKPAGMTGTAVRVYKPGEIPNMARGYTLVGRDGQPLPPEPAPDPSAPAGTLRDDGDRPRIGNPSGDAYSTLADLLAFAQAVTGHKLLGKALTDTVLAGKVDSGRPGAGEDRYAYGFADTRINGVRIVGHNGGTPGYGAQVDIYPDRGYTVVILTNQDQVLLPAIRRSQEMLTG